MANENNQNNDIGEIVTSIVCGIDNSPLKRISKYKLQCIQCSHIYETRGIVVKSTGSTCVTESGSHQGYRHYDEGSSIFGCV